VCGYTVGTCLDSFGNTVAAENYASTIYSNISVNVNDLGFNYFGDDNFVGGCMTPLSRVGTLPSPLHPQLGPLLQNGGGLPTHAPMVGSPVIDWGFAFGTTTDERGAPRPYGSPAPGSGGDGSDVGAVEFGSPAMGMGKVGNGVVISWPAYYGDFILQSGTNLNEPGNWSNVTNTPAVVNNQFTVTNGITGPRQFFRLINR
jgi:hypothetical protein